MQTQHMQTQHMQTQHMQTQQPPHHHIHFPKDDGYFPNEDGYRDYDILFEDEDPLVAHASTAHASTAHASTPTPTPTTVLMTPASPSPSASAATTTTKTTTTSQAPPELLDDDAWMKAVLDVISSIQSSFLTHVLLLLLASLTVAYFLSLDDQWVASHRLAVMRSYATSLFGSFFVYLFLEYVLELTSKFLLEASTLGVQGFFLAPFLMVVNWVRFVLLVTRYCFYLTALFYWITHAMRLVGVPASKDKETTADEPLRDLVDMRRVRDFSSDLGVCGYSWSTDWGGEKQEMLVQKGTNADPRENAAGKLAWLAEKITPTPAYINEKVTPVLVKVGQWTLGLNTALGMAQFGSASIFGMLFNAVFSSFSFVSLFWGVFVTGITAYLMNSDAISNATTAATHCALSKITSFFIFVMGLYPADMLFQHAVEAGTPSPLYLAISTPVTRKMSALFHNGAVCTRRSFSALINRMAGKPDQIEKDMHISAVIAAYKQHPSEMSRMYIEETDEEKEDATRKLQMMRPGIELKFNTGARATYDAARLDLQTKLADLLTYENIGPNISTLDQFGFDIAALAPGLSENRTGALEPETLKEMVGAPYDETDESGGDLEVRRNVESTKRLFSDFDCGGPEAASKECCDITRSLYGGQKISIRLPGLDGSPARDANNALIPPSVIASAVPLPP